MAGSYWDKITEKRISRRRALQGAGTAGVAAGAIWLVGCGSDDDDGGGNGATNTPDTSGTPTNPNEPDIVNEKNPPVPGGRYLVSNTANFDTFDPHLGIASSTAYFPRIYNVLVNQSAVKPGFFFFDLAEKYENPDDVTWNFTLRSGVKVGPNDLGVPERDMDGEDVVATFDRIKNEPRANNGAFVKEFVESVTATGNVVTIKTTKPFAWFLNRVGNFVNAIPPRELIANEASIENMRARSAGAGPYRLLRSTEGEGATLDKNPNYYRKDERNNNAALPYLEGIDVRLIADRSAARTAFQSGQLHTYAPETKSEADEFRRNSDYVVTTDPVNTFIALTMHPEKDPFTDIRARQAFGYAINRKQYVDIVYEGDAQVNGLVHWPTGVGVYAFSESELEQLQPYDPAEARKLVDALGGLKVKMIYPASSAVEQHDKHLPIFLEQMKDANIEIEQDPQDFTTWLENYRTLNYVLSLSLNQVYETPETPLNFHIAKGPIGDRSYAVGLNDAEIEAAVEKTKTTLDFEELSKAVLDAQRLIYEKGPTFLPFVSPVGYTAYTNRLHNIASGLGASGLLVSTAWLEA
jgi:peptide/nickel transport system substrate-binding protein